MNRKTLLRLSIFGVVIGIASLFGLTRGIEWLLWLAIALISAFVLAREARSRLFLSGLVVGVLDGIANSVIQFLFFTTYLQNNPETAESLVDGPLPISPRYFFLIAGPFVGLLYGVVVGLFSVIGGKIIQKEDGKGRPSDTDAA